MVAGLNKAKQRAVLKEVIYLFFLWDWFTSIFVAFNLTISNDLSFLARITCDVPQGSILGPFFKKIYSFASNMTRRDETFLSIVMLMTHRYTLY